MRAKAAAEAALAASFVPVTILRSTYLMETLSRHIRGSKAVVLGHHRHPYLDVRRPEPHTLTDALRRYCPQMLSFRFECCATLSGLSKILSTTCPVEEIRKRSATPRAAAPLVLPTTAAPAPRVAARRPCDRAGPMRDVVQVAAADRIVFHGTAGTIGIVAHLGHSGRHECIVRGATRGEVRAGKRVKTLRRWRRAAMGCGRAETHSSSWERLLSVSPDSRVRTELGRVCLAERVRTALRPGRGFNAASASIGPGSLEALRKRRGRRVSPGCPARCFRSA